MRLNSIFHSLTQTTAESEIIRSYIRVTRTIRVEEFTERETALDDMLDAVADIQRRKLLVALLDHNPQDDSPAILADAADETDAFERIVQMEHVHLPKLAEYGFIDWNEEGDKVSKGPNFDEIRPLLELLLDHEDELPEDWF